VSDGQRTGPVLQGRVCPRERCGPVERENSVSPMRLKTELLTGGQCLPGEESRRCLLRDC
jgi:hypothetical protein